ncbi:MAG: DUF4980 domain-containing protein [Prevotella sp.]|nr:DUF4980 domain-containing protein [Prevotella sp.]
MKKLLLFCLLCLFSTNLSAVETTVKMKIIHQYLNFPVSHKADRKAMRIVADGKEYCRFVVRLTAEEPDYWVFQDVSEFKGKTIELSFDGPQAALERICQDDTFPGEESLYQEAFRPQYHFTTRRGWINDPNGLVYDRSRGEYHLFYQHNPYEREWENMHWGHAVSTDLIHWKELPDALHPDTIGTMFSGSALFDYDNAAGFNRPAKVNKRGKVVEPEQVAMIVYYTADHPKYQRQCMAYSLDGGRTFTKYEGNPVIDSHERWQSHDTRDPKIFKMPGGKDAKAKYVLVLNERDGHTIYNSTDLKNWYPVSHITGFWECPELFEVPSADAGATPCWVLWGASGTYMLGQFDGNTFVPSGPKLMNFNGSAYAAQCFNQLPEPEGSGKSLPVKMAWGRIAFPDMPFNGCMLLPQTQEVRPTAQGPCLYSYPIAETEQLFTKVIDKENLSQREANDLLKPFNGNDVLRIRTTIRLTYATDASLRYRGQRLFDYDMNGNRLQGEFYVNPQQPGCMDLTLDLYIDRAIVEAYVDGGAFSYSFQRDVHRNDAEGYAFYGNQLQIKRLEVFTAKSIWL